MYLSALNSYWFPFACTLSPASNTLAPFTKMQSVVCAHDLLPFVRLSFPLVYICVSKPSEDEAVRPKPSCLSGASLFPSLWSLCWPSVPWGHTHRDTMHPASQWPFLIVCEPVFWKSSSPLTASHVSHLCLCVIDFADLIPLRVALKKLQVMSWLAFLKWLALGLSPMNLSAFLSCDVVVAVCTLLLRVLMSKAYPSCLRCSQPFPAALINLMLQLEIPNPWLGSALAPCDPVKR